MSAGWKHRGLLVALSSLATGLIVAGCALAQSVPVRVSPAATKGPLLGPERTGAPAPSAPTRSALRPQPPRAGAKAVDFTLRDLQGTQVSLSDFVGKKVMLNFWATWCGPCRIEIPHMVQLYDEIRDQGFEIVAVNLREDPERVERFVKEYEMAFPVLLDEHGKVAASYFVRGIPTSLFLDEEGVIQTVHTGTLTEALLQQYVDDLMD